MRIEAGFQTVALLLQEAVTRLCHEDILRRLRKAVYEIGRESEDYCYICAVFGDDKSGDVVYSAGYDNGLRKAPYTMTDAATVIDTAKAVEVMPVTTYEVQGTGSVEATEAGARNSRRDLAQLQSIHDAAAGLGATCKVKGKVKGRESVSRETEHEFCESPLALQESTSFEVDLDIAEAAKAAGGLRVKIIAPGKGSTAFYTEEVLKRDGPKVFKAGTPMRIDHPTQAEESARPEGSVRDWGAVLSSNAVWMDEATGPRGAGLYAEIKPFSDHEATIREKGPYAGVSIRAQGTALMEGGKPVMRDGVPVLGSFVSAEGVDMVTRAGAGGLFLSESAKKDQTEGAGMDEATIKRLIAEGISAGISTAINPLRERAVKGDATVAGTMVLGPLPLSEAQKSYVLQSVVRGTLPLTEAGELDEPKFQGLVMEEAKRFASTLPDASIVLNMGGGTAGGGAQQMTEAELQARESRELAVREAEMKSELAVFSNLMGNEAAARLAVQGRA